VILLKSPPYIMGMFLSSLVKEAHFYLCSLAARTSLRISWVGGAKRLFVVATMKRARGSPAPRSLPIGGKTASLTDKAERGERAEPIKPFQRISGERKLTFLRADQDIATSSSIFHAWKHPGACLQFGWQETSAVSGNARQPTIPHRYGKLVGRGRHVWAVWQKGFQRTQTTFIPRRRARGAVPG
jgi:hypothetical protein